MRKNINGEMLTLEETLKKHKYLVCKVANQVRIQGRKLSLEIEDLESIGAVGMMKAYERFDEAYAVRFSTYAIPLIRGEILNYFRVLNPMVKFPRTIKDWGGKLKTDQVDVKSERDISEHLNIPMEKAKEVFRYLHNDSFSSIQEFTEDDMTVEQLIFVEQDFSEVEVEDFIKRLSDREQLIVQHIMEGYSQSAAAKEAGIRQPSASRVLKAIGEKYNDFQRTGRIKPNSYGQGDLKKAKELLAETDLPIADIIDMTGVRRMSLYRYVKELRGKKTS